MLISKFIAHDMEAETAAFEAQYGITLPEQYRRFLLKYNGGDTPKTKFRSEQGSFDIRAFYGIGVPHFSLTEIRDPERFLKRNLLPVACDFSGNHIAVVLSGRDAGKICFLDHEKGYRQTLLADSLKAFAEACESQEIGHIRTIEERRAQRIAASGISEIPDAVIAAWQAEIDRFGRMHQEPVVIDS